ncbi:MAG: phosphoglycerate dehydrogenase [Gammaproteobacteria bacterium]
MTAPKISLAKDKIRILLLEGVHPSAIENLHRAGYTNIESLDRAASADELLEKIQDAHFIGIRSRTQLTESVLENAKKLIGIGCFCIGTNQVDLDAAAARGIIVFNAPYSNTRSVAELVLAQTIMLMRGIPEKNAKAHRGDWMKSAKDSHEIRGKILGIIGYGSIGSQLSVIAESLGMQVRYYDIETKLPLGNAEPVLSLKELLSISDVVTLHVPETPSTKNMIGAAEIEHMRDGAMLINASRGTVVDIDALAAALKVGKVGGAAIDVFPKEPRSNSDRFESPLQGLDNVILTPHIGGSTVEAQANIGLEVSEKFIKYSDNGSTLSAVNFPEVSLPKHTKSHRLLHVHRNIPGVISEVNRVFSENNINICSQYLQTNEKIGYVVIDIEAQSSETALKKLQNINGTIRCRVLY